MTRNWLLNSDELQAGVNSEKLRRVVLRHTAKGGPCHSSVIILSGGLFRLRTSDDCKQDVNKSDDWRYETPKISAFAVFQMF